MPNTIGQHSRTRDCPKPRQTTPSPILPLSAGLHLSLVCIPLSPMWLRRKVLLKTAAPQGYAGPRGGGRDRRPVCHDRPRIPVKQQYWLLRLACQKTSTLWTSYRETRIVSVGRHKTYPRQKKGLTLGLRTLSPAECVVLDDPFLQVVAIALVIQPTQTPDLETPLGFQYMRLSLP